MTWPNGDNTVWPNGDNAVWTIYMCSSSNSVFDVNAARGGSADCSVYDVIKITCAADCSVCNIIFVYCNASVSVFDINGNRKTKGSIALSNVFVADGFFIFAREITTGAINKLGFLHTGNDESTLAGINLADGEYDIEARPSGNYWDRCRNAKLMRVLIVDGEIVVRVAPVLNLSADLYSALGRNIHWSWQTTFGATDPYDFGIWFSATTLVDTSGAPDFTIVAQESGVIHSIIYPQTELTYVAVCGRDNNQNNGPVSQITLDYPAGIISGPDVQWAVPFV